MQETTDTRVSRGNPTLRTLQKIKSVIEGYSGVFSTAAIYKNANVNYHAIRPCLEELEKQGIILRLASTGKGDVYLRQSEIESIQDRRRNIL